MFDKDTTNHFNWGPAKRTFAIQPVCALICLLLVWTTETAEARPNPPNLCNAEGCLTSSPMHKVKWHPGHYMQLLRNRPMQIFNKRKKLYNSIQYSEDFVGVFVGWEWSQLEGDTKGDYSAGIAAVKADIAHLKNLHKPKRFVLKIIDAHFGNTREEPENSKTFPLYIRSEGLVYQGRNAVGWCRWNPTAMGHYIDMLKAYAAAFDDEPYFEGIILYKETAPMRKRDDAPCGYTTSSYQSQTKRLINEVVSAFPRTNVLLALNFMTNQTKTNAMAAELASARAGISGPDVLPPSCSGYQNGTWGYRALRGDDGGPDYRGIIPSIWSIENSEMGGALGHCTPDELGRFANESLHASHLGWDRNTFQGDATTQWGAIASYVANSDNALQHTGCPSQYTQGCTSD